MFCTLRKLNIYLNMCLSSICLTLELSDDEISAQAFLFFLAGYETTASLMRYSSHTLAVHPEIDAKLIEEIETKIGDVSLFSALIYINVQLFFLYLWNTRRIQQDYLTYSVLSLITVTQFAICVQIKNVIIIRIDQLKHAKIRFNFIFRVAQHMNRLPASLTWICL